MNFKERVKPDTKITVMPRKIPYVLVSTVALQKMFTYTDLCADEIGWLGTAVRDANEIQITDVFLFGQEVHGATTEITPEGLASFATELLEQADGMEVWNNMRVWGHSHVNMAINPSGQDDKQMEEFANIGHEWFVRLICNKKGELSVDVYDYEEGAIYKNVAWERLMTAEEETIRVQIAQMQETLDNMSGTGLTELKPVIEAEMKLKVHKKTYTHPGTTAGRTTGLVVNAYGRYVNGQWKAWKVNMPSREEMRLYEEHIPVDVWNDAVEVHLMEKADEKKTAPSASLIHDEEDVYKFFNEHELKTLAWSVSADDVGDQMADYGYEDQFSGQDLRTIFRVALKEGTHHMGGYEHYGITHY